MPDKSFGIPLSKTIINKGWDKNNLYHSNLHVDTRKTVERTACIIKASQIEFGTLAFRGMSGALVGPMLADHMEKSWILLRKPCDKTHSSHRYVGEVLGSCLILDDFVETGATIEKIKETLRGWGHTCVGFALYAKGVVSSLYVPKDEHYYTRYNCQTKTALKQAVKRKTRINFFSPGTYSDRGLRDGSKIIIRGPHFPRRHTWKAECTVKGDRIIAVK